MKLETILSLWKKEFSKNKFETIIWDNILGMQTKKDFIIKAYFISQKIKKVNGDYVGIMLPALGGASLLIIATYLAGKTPVMFNWTLGKEAFDHCVNFSKVENIITVGTFYDKVKNDFLEEHKSSGKFLFLENLLKSGTVFEKVGALAKSFYMPIPELNENAVILFTSGSESLPKAVALTHKNIISDISGALGIFDLKSDDILLGFLPPFHSFGFTINTIMPLITGLKTAYTPDPNDAKTIVEIIKHTKVTAITSTPTFLKMILSVAKNDDLKTIKYAVVGAEKCPESLALNFANFCPNGKILEGYGITECSPVISINPPNKPKLGSVGLPIIGSEIVILSLNDKAFLPPNKEGMIYFSGDNVFSGYMDENLENPFEEIALTPLPEGEGNKKRYYKTGDLGYLDDEGYLYITGRLKRFVKIAGEMISLPFVEGVLSKKYGSDTENKIAIEALEDKGNVKIVLFATYDLNLDEVNNYLRNSGVSNLIKISEIIKIDSIPVLGTGKTDYKILKKMISFENKNSNYDFSNIKETIIKKISELSKIEISKIDENSVFGKDINLDSIDVGELTIFVKTNYKNIETRDLKDIKTVKELISIIK